MDKNRWRNIKQQLSPIDNEYRASQSSQIYIVLANRDAKLMLNPNTEVVGTTQTRAHGIFFLMGGGGGGGGGIVRK